MDFSETFSEDCSYDSYISASSIQWVGILCAPPKESKENYDEDC